MNASTRTTLITLGSNIDPERHIVAALEALDELLGIEEASPIYEADPVGNPGMPRFLNAAVRITTDLPPGELKFAVIRPLERRLGRVRTTDPNAPRTIDIDIAAVQGLILDEEELQLPDPEIPARAHLAVPLADVAPRFRHPGLGITLGEIAARFRGEPGLAKRDDVRWP